MKMTRNMDYRKLYILALSFVTMQTFAGGTVKYEYDANYRLTKVTYSSGIVVTYTYDELGNRLSKVIMSGFVKGDVNGDGKVNAADIVELINVVNGKPSGAYNAQAADINGDGEVTADDVDGIVDIILKKE